MTQSFDQYNHTPTNPSFRPLGTQSRDMVQVTEVKAVPTGESS